MLWRIVLLVVSLAALPTAVAHSQTANEIYERGRVAYEQGDIRGAFDLFTKAISLGYQDIAIYYNRGLAGVALQRYDHAMKDFSKVIDVNPGFALAYVQRGIVYTFLEKYDEAVAEHNRALAINPSFLEAIQNRAYAYFRKGAFEAAAQDYDTFLASDPDNATVRFMRGATNYRLGKPNLAIQDLSHAIALEPNEPDYLRERAIVYESIGRGKDAEADIRKADQLKSGVSDQPRSSVSSNGRGQTDFNRDTRIAKPKTPDRSSNVTNYPGQDGSEDDEYFDDEYYDLDDTDDLASSIIRQTQSAIQSGSVGSSSIMISGNAGTSIRQVQNSGNGDGPTSEQWEESGYDPPDITIIGVSRAVYGGMDVVKVSGDVLIEGQAVDSDGIAELVVNGKTAKWDRQGRFKSTTARQGNGVTVTIYARDRKGNSTQYTAVYPYVSQDRPYTPVDTDTRGPEITILTPRVQKMRGFDVVTRDQTLYVSGIASDESGIRSVTVNNKTAKLEDDGRFSVTVALLTGENVLKVHAEDGVGNMGDVQYTILREDDPAPSRDVTPPVITIVSPNVTPSRGLDVVATEAVLQIRGIAKDESGVRTVRVNQREARLTGDGAFEAFATLEGNQNRIIVEAVDLVGNAGKMEFIVRRSTDNDDNPKPAPSLDRKDYALLFASDDYDHWPGLNNPIKDAKTLAEELEDNFGFEVELVTNATSERVLTTLRSYMSKSFGPNDQLLVFFAGHGYHDELTEAYLVTVDSKARGADPAGASYITFSTLLTRIDNLPCEHVFLVMDVCHGGLIAGNLALRGDDGYDEIRNEEFVNRILSRRTRLYLTSGGEEYVPDGRPGHHSPFMWKFLDVLKSHAGRDQILTSKRLYTLMDRLPNLPRFDVFGSPAPGCDFLFISR